MAALHVFSRRPILASATTVSVLASIYYISRPRPLLLDSPSNPPTPTLVFPNNIIFSKTLKVTHVEQVNHDTKRITFALPGGDREISGLSPGGAILTQSSPSGSFFPVFRPYTPIHDLNKPGVLELLVKKYPNGKASTHMHTLQPGQELTVRGPVPGTAWTTPKDQRDIILIAGGAGITPIYSLAKGILSNPADKTRMQLLWGVNGTRDIVLKAELEELERQFPDRLRVRYAVSGPEAAPDAPSLGDEDKYSKGHVTKALLANAIEQCKKGSWDSEAGKKVFLCGPPKMEDAIAGRQGVLQELGVQKKDVHRF